MTTIAKHTKPFSQRLIDDLRPYFLSSFIVNGMQIDAIEMGPVKDDEELETVSGSQFVFTIRATATKCSPRGLKPAQ